MIILKFTILILKGIRKEGERKWGKPKASAAQDQYGNRSQDVSQNTSKSISKAAQKDNGQQP